MELSLIIPAQNRKHVIKAYIDTWLSCTGLDYEIVIVDYMSTDHLCGYIKKINNPKIKLVKVHGNAGFNLSKCRNIGIKCASGPLTFTMDCDVQIRRNDTLAVWTRRYYEYQSYNPKKRKDGLVMATVGRGNTFQMKSLWEESSGFPHIFRTHGFEDDGFQTRYEAIGGYFWWPPYFMRHRRNNKWFFTAKPKRDRRGKELKDGRCEKGYIPAVSVWEDQTADRNKTLRDFTANPDKYLDGPLPNYEII